MRSVFIHIIEATPSDVDAFFSKQFPGHEGRWFYPTPPDDSILYIHFSEPDPEDLPAIRAALGMKPQVTLVANVSGRHSGDEEVRHFIETNLSHFSGVAQDDYTDHAWTLAEIRSDHRYKGHKFFDYDGWYREQKQME